MSVVLDTSAVLALYDADDPVHARAAAWVGSVDEDLVTTPIVLAEIQRAVLDRGGDDGRRALLDDLDRGAFQVRWWADALRETLGIIDEQGIDDLGAASLVALAGLLRTDRIATLDPRFATLETPSGQPFRLVI